MSERLTVPEVLPLVRTIYAARGGACCLHNVLENGNVRDESVRARVDLAAERGHEDCRMLAEKLLLMSKTQRRKLGGLALGA
jgi:hypothetical protein